MFCWGSPTEVPELFPRGMARGPTDVVVNLADKIDKLRQVISAAAKVSLNYSLACWNRVLNHHG